MGSKKSCQDKHSNSIVFTINENNREDVISSLLSHNYRIEWNKRGKRNNLHLSFKNQY